jgi:hypothetical protein
MTREQMLSAIRDFYEDTTRTSEETLEGLQDALEDIQVLIETLEG